MPKIIVTSHRPEAMPTTTEEGIAERLAGLRLTNLGEIKAIAKRGNHPKLEITYDPQNQNKARVDIVEEEEPFKLDIDDENDENKDN